jgi:hypothetical protein
MPVIPWGSLPCFFAISVPSRRRCCCCLRRQVAQLLFSLSCLLSAASRRVLSNTHPPLLGAPLHRGASPPGLARRLSAVLWVESPPRSTISHQHRKLNPCFISALPSDPYFRTAKNRSEGLGITLMEHWILPPRASRHGQSPSHVFDCLCRDPQGV